VTPAIAKHEAAVIVNAGLVPQPAATDPLGAIVPPAPDVEAWIV
jgi:hypothetical protein